MRRSRIVLSAAAIGVALAIAGCTGGDEPDTTTSPSVTEAPSASATPTPTPTPSAAETPSPTVEELLQQDLSTEAAQEQFVEAVVETQAPQVCSLLVSYPSLDLAVAAEQYAGLWEAQGIDEAQQVVLAEQVLAESAATQCPDQSERVTESFGG